MSRRSALDRNLAYRLRLLACLATVLVLIIGAVHFWPNGTPAPPEAIIYMSARPLEITSMVPTHQERAAPAPPPPLPPVPVPDRTVLEQPELEFSNAARSLPPAPSDGILEGNGTTTRGTASPAPDVTARPLSIVEPTYTEAAQRRHVRAHVVVEVLVGTDGRVRTVRVVERLLLDEKKRPIRTVSRLGYGLEEAALEAARRTRFRPARSDGHPVESYKTLTIRFGV